MEDSNPLSDASHRTLVQNPINPKNKGVKVVTIEQLRQNLRGIYRFHQEIKEARKRAANR